MNILIFVFIAILSSAVCHYLIKSYILSAIGAAFFTSISFQIVSYIVDGYIDPFFFIAFLISWLLSFLIALLVGLPFLLERKKTKT